MLPPPPPPPTRGPGPLASPQPLCCCPWPLPAWHPAGGSYGPSGVGQSLRLPPRPGSTRELPVLQGSVPAGGGRETFRNDRRARHSPAWHRVTVKSRKVGAKARAGPSGRTCGSPAVTGTVRARRCASPRPLAVEPSQLSCGLPATETGALLRATTAPGRLRERLPLAGEQPRRRHPLLAPRKGLGAWEEADLPEAQVQNTCLPSPSLSRREGPTQCKPRTMPWPPPRSGGATLPALSQQHCGALYWTSDVGILCGLRFAFLSHLIWTPRYSPTEGGGAPEGCGTHLSGAPQGRLPGSPPPCWSQVLAAGSSKLGASSNAGAVGAAEHEAGPAGAAGGEHTFGALTLGLPGPCD